MTVSLLSTLKNESRDRLYFDQWQYAFSFWLKEAHTLRHRSVAELDRCVGQRMSWAHWEERYTENVVSNLKIALDFINHIKQPFKLTVSGHWASIYTNDPDISDDLIAHCPFTKQHRIKQAVVDRPRDTVLLLEPTHQIRSYFKSQQFPGAKIPALRDFFAAQGDSIKPSMAMQQFLKGTRHSNHWIPDHYYVDYNDPVYATMLALIMPRAFRKTVPIVQRINT